MEAKTATSIEEQIEKLKERGIIIQSEEKAKEILLDIGYFRLGFYCFPYEKNYPNKKNRDHIYNKDTRLKDIVHLYYFDFDLRNILLKYINRIEINFRTYLTYTVSNQYKSSQAWFTDPTIVDNDYASSFEEKVYNSTFKRNPVIKRHHIKHINDKFAPAWKTIEFMTFGAILQLYKNLKNDTIKRTISSHYKVGAVDIFNNYMETIRIIRNTCAHGGVLFDISLPQSIRKGPAGAMADQTRSNLKGAIDVITYILTQISANRAADLQTEIRQLLSNNQDILPVKNIIEKCSGYHYTSIPEQ